MSNLQSVAFMSPRSRNNVVKISFHSNYTARGSGTKNLRMQISIGNQVARELQWKHNDRIEIKSLNNKIILNKMIDFPDEDQDYKNFRGYKLTKVNRSYSFNLNIRSFLVPKIMKIRVVPHRIIYIENDIKELELLWEDK